ncbi:MAG: NAD-dependent epimerase/dehydratase family protein [Hyphomicrobium sp.]|nr:NAD-dependent epimerase/dehydratase family protein [Hyphomicrobium sp.]
MKIFVTGATGFVGAACADALARDGHVVVCGTRRRVVDGAPQRAWAVHGDLASDIDWRDHLTGCDGVLHCAGLASVADDVSNEDVDAINVEATARLAEAAADAGIKRFVYISSALAATADDGNRYATSKRAAEKQIGEIAGRRGMDWVILRPPMIYGAGNSGNFARLVHRIENGWPLPLACATAPKSFVAIDNLASAVARVFENPHARNRTFFVADDEQTSTAALVRDIAGTLGQPVRLLPVPASVMQRLGRVTGKAREIKSLFDPAVVDTADIRKVLSWSPPVAQGDAIRDAVLGMVHQNPQRRKIAFVVTEDWFMCSHFLPLIREARVLDLDVIVITRVRQHAAVLQAEGVRVIAINARRSSANPLALVFGVGQLRAILRRENPDIVHAIALRMVIAGGLAARFAGVRNVVLAPTGLGHLWSSRGWPQRIARAMIRFVTRHVLRRPGTVFVFENRDDPADLGLDAAGHDIVVVAGAGVDSEIFQPSLAPPAPPLKIAVVSRMTRAKGVLDSVAAVRAARAGGADVELHLFGAVDTDNLGALSESELRALSAEGGITWHGVSNDVPSVWRAHHTAMLLTSYREGIPRTLIEAAACGRPSIATDVIGCREIVRDGVDGFLVPPGDVLAAADAIIALAGDARRREAFGQAARAHFLDVFTEAAIRQRFADVYRRMLNREPGSGE